MMAISSAWGYDLKESWRLKSLANITLCLYITVLFSAGFFVGFFALRQKEETPNELLEFLHCSNPAYNREDGMLKTPYCPPAVNVFFLKTHKCASSTIQNILMRYGDEHNLTFVLPDKSNYIGHPEPFSKSMVSKSSSQQFNILCHHLRFNAVEVREVLPKNTVFVSILRNPVRLFRSMYDYYDMGTLFNQTLEEFVQDKDSMRKLNSKRHHNRLGRNQMLFDFGYDKDIWDNRTLIKKAIQEIDKSFDLIMISELFDESLILLKHKLCWTTVDIVYLMHNMRTRNVEEFKTAELAPKVEKYNAADKMLYDYFHNKLKILIEIFGKEKMDQEVKDLRLWNSIWFSHCVKKISVQKEDVPSENKAYNSKVYSFVLNDEPVAQICKNLAIEELQYTEKLRSKQKYSLFSNLFD